MIYQNSQLPDASSTCTATILATAIMLHFMFMYTTKIRPPAMKYLHMQLLYSV